MFQSTLSDRARASARLRRLAGVCAGALAHGGLDCRATSQASSATRELPARLGDQEFWKLSEDLSEPGGSFRSDNLLSNEIGFPAVIGDLVARTKPGGVYMGVGPEQNFHYIAAHQAEDGLHHRHPARQPAPPADVQGALRALGGSRRVRLPAVHEAAAGRASTAKRSATRFDERVLGRQDQRRGSLQGQPAGHLRSCWRRSTGFRSRPTIARESSTSTTTSIGSAPRSRTRRACPGSRGGRATYHSLMTQPDGSGVFAATSRLKRAFSSSRICSRAT